MNTRWAILLMLVAIILPAFLGVASHQTSGEDEMASTSGGAYNAVVTYDRMTGDSRNPNYHYFLDIYVYSGITPYNVQLNVSDFQNAVSFSNATFPTNPRDDYFANSWSVSLSNNVLSLSCSTSYSSDHSYSENNYLTGRNGSNRSSTFTFDEIRVHATPLPQYTLTVVASGSGSVSGGGTYTSGSTATLTATPDAHNKFVQWQDGDTSNPRSVTVTGNATYTAIFAWMTPVLSAKVGGSYVDGDVKVKVNGQWTDAKKVFVKVNGTWTESRTR